MENPEAGQTDAVAASAPASTQPQIDGIAQTQSTFPEVLLLPPTFRDGEAIAKLLAGADIRCRIFVDTQAVCQAIEESVGAVIISEEMLVASPDIVARCLQQQPVWSDLPIIVLSHGGFESPALANVLPRIGNVSVLERPVRLTTFLSVVKSSLRARQRQFQVREHLEEIRRADIAVQESGERFKTLFEGIDDGFCIIQCLFDSQGRSSDYRFVDANPAFFKETGLSRDAIGRTIRETTPGIEQSWIETYGRVSLTGEAVRFENRSDALNRWFEVYAFRFGPIESRQVAVFFKNVTSRKQTELALSKARQRIDSSLLAGELGTYYWDIVTNRVTGDRNFALMFGVIADDKTSAPVEDFISSIHPDDAATVAAKIKNTLETDASFHAEYRIRNRGGERWVIARGIVERNESREPIGWAGVIVDITSRKRVEEERQALLESERSARADAERISRMKDEFLATLSHELRTPLNAILGWTQIIRGNPQDVEDVSQGLETIERNARAQAQIIEDLLDMSRIISGKVRLDVQQLDLSAIVRAAVDTARPTAEAKGVRLQAVIDPLHGVVVSGDGNRLQQVLWNLLSNAIKFTPRDGRVQVHLERINSHIEINVRDTGEGITAEFLPFVFDRFRQADASTTRLHGGLGLGLSIVKQLVELHGGTIRAASDGPGTGSRFAVNLPLLVMQTSSREEPKRRHPSAALVSSGLSEGCVNLKGVRVLAVDDESDARALVKRLLEDCEAVVTIARSTDEAIELLTRGTFDVLVSDIGMPGEDGFALIKRVRSLDKSKGGNIPAIALTAYARAEDRVRVIAAGFQMHLAKPVEAIELVTMVASAAAWATSLATP